MVGGISPWRIIYYRCIQRFILAVGLFELFEYGYEFDIIVIVCWFLMEVIAIYIIDGDC